MKKDAPAPPLVKAATELQQALAAYERAARDLDRQELDSRRNLARAGEGLVKIEKLEAEMAVLVTALVQAVGTARDAQQAQAEGVQRRAAEIVERRNVLAGLLSEVERLGQEAAKLATDLDGLPATEQAPVVGGRLTELALRAQALAADAQAKGFNDLAVEGHALRQQLLAVKNRAGLLAARKPD